MSVNSSALSQRTREGQGTRLLFMGKAWASSPSTIEQEETLAAGLVSVELE